MDSGNFGFYTFRLGPGSKEYVERRHGEPIRFLFLPKMGILGNQASTEKKSIMNYELLLRAFFHVFMGQKKVFFNTFYIVASALKSCIISIL